MYLKHTQICRENPETANAWKKWTTEEEEKLVTELNDMTYEELALLHKRTVGGIKTRVLKMALDECNDGENIYNVSEKYNVTEEQIKEYSDKQIKTAENRIKNREKRKESKKKLLKLEKEGFYENRQIELLIEIRDLLQIIAKK